MKYDVLLEKYSTPFYLYDIETLKERIAYLKHHLGARVDLVYAVKANTFVVPYVYDYVDKLELCSFGEYVIAVKAKVPFEKMVISGVYKDELSMRQMFEQAIPGKFTIESMGQWELLERLTEEYGKSIKLLLRLTSGNQFGMRKEEVLDIVKNRRNDRMQILGIQYFAKTQRRKLSILESELEKLESFVRELEEESGIELEEFEYGPGFPVYYFEGDDFDEEEFLKGFRTILDRVFADKKVSIELGRSVTASCGQYLTRVVDCKESEAGRFAIVDGGINHIAYYGQTMAIKVPYHEVLPKREGDDSYIVVGSLCTINDILVKDFRAGNLQVGDVLLFKNAGAYCSTEGISLFLSRDLPRVLIADKDKVIQVRDAFPTSDLNG